MGLAEPVSPITPPARLRSLTPPSQPRGVRGPWPLDSVCGFSSLARENTPHSECRPAEVAAISDGSVALVTAIQQRDLDALEHLLRNNTAHVDVNCLGLRPLHRAFRATLSQSDGGFKMVELLLRYGANPNLHPGDAKMELPLLHGAALVGDVALVSLLLGFRAIANGVDAHGSTALHTLCQQKFALGGAAAKRQTVDMLLRHGANPMALDSAGCTPEGLAFDPQLQAQLRRASCCYTCATMTVACRRFHGRCDAVERRNPFLSCPDLQNQLVAFVCGTALPQTHDCSTAAAPCWWAQLPPPCHDNL